MERRGKVGIQKHSNRKDQILIMSDYGILNTMDEDELREFALFAYTSYPTLLTTHLIRKAFHAQYPEKDPNQNTLTAHQLELVFE